MIGGEEYLTLFSGNGWAIYNGCSGAAISLSTDIACNRNCVCVINGNNTSQSGGAVRVTCGCLTLNDSVFDCNRTSYCGGAIFACCGCTTVNSSNINNNCACCHGGGIYACGSGTCVAVNGSCIDKNCAGHGGGVYADNQACVTIGNSCIDGNCATGCGGAATICNQATGIFCCDTITNNHATGYAGGIMAHCNGKVCIIGTTICGNCGQYGGGLFAENCSCTIICDSNFFNNCSTICGGAIYASGGCLIFCGMVCICGNCGACPGIHLNSSNACAIVYGTIYDWDGITGCNNWCCYDSGCVCCMNPETQESEEPSEPDEPEDNNDEGDEPEEPEEPDDLEEPNTK